MDEVEKKPSIGTDEEKDNIEFVLWAKKGADKINTNKVEYDGLDIQVADMGDHSRIISYLNDEPVGYVAIEPFEDGVKIGTLAVGFQYRGKGIAKRMYDFIIQNNVLYSDDNQTPEAMGLWRSLGKRYNVKAVNVETGEETSIDQAYTEEGESPNNVHLVISAGGK
jgi:ribosomal protein S18 acetylase RimI-like enzyme